MIITMIVYEVGAKTIFQNISISNYQFLPDTLVGHNEDMIAGRDISFATTRK